MGIILSNTPANTSAHGLDLDGVIVISMPFYSETVEYLKAEWGIELTPIEIVTKLKGLTFDECLPHFQKRYKQHHGTNLPDTYRKAAKDAFTEIIKSIPTTPIPGMVEAIQTRLEQDPHLFIASNSIRKRLNLKLEAITLNHCFNGNALSKNDVPAPKPAPDILHKGLQSLNLTFSNDNHHSFTGDGIVDMQAGLAGNFKHRVACFFEYPELADLLWPHFQDAGATHMVKNPNEWLDFVNCPP